MAWPFGFRRAEADRGGDDDCQHRKAAADRAPAREPEQPGQRRADRDAAEAADRHHETVEERQPADRKMLRERLERRTEAHRYADADQEPADHHRAEVVRDAEHRGAGRREQQHPGRHAARAEMVEQHAGRNLRAGEAEEIKAGEQTEIGGRQPELVRDERREAEIDAAKHIRHEIPDRKQREHPRLHR